MAAEPVRVERGELFRQVWETPIVRLAASYGITDKGLAKICDRLDVPYPARGWWAKKNSGKRVAAGVLRINPDVPAFVLITPTLKPSTQPVEAIPESAESLATRVVADVLALIEEPPAKAHPIVARRMGFGLDGNKSTTWFGEPEFAEVKQRLDKILTALLRGIEKHGAIVEAAAGSISATFGTQTILFRLQPRHIHLKRDRSGVESVLVFKIDTKRPGRREWRDTPLRTMESWLPEIVRVFVAIKVQDDEQAARAKAAAERHAAEAPARQAASDAALQASVRNSKDAGQWARLAAHAQRWDAAEAVRRFLVALEATEHDPSRMIGDLSVAEWLAWGREQASKRGPLDASAVFAVRIETLTGYREPP
jgi:hypothetical protein